jgi:hypothetical protein
LPAGGGSGENAQPCRLPRDSWSGRHGHGHRRDRQSCRSGGSQPMASGMLQHKSPSPATAPSAQGRVTTWKEGGSLSSQEESKKIGSESDSAPRSRICGRRSSHSSTQLFFLEPFYRTSSQAVKKRDDRLVKELMFGSLDPRTSSILGRWCCTHYSHIIQRHMGRYDLEGGSYWGRD